MPLLGQAHQDADRPPPCHEADRRRRRRDQKVRLDWVDVAKTLVAHDQLVVAIKEGKAVRDRLDRGAQPHFRGNVDGKADTVTVAGAAVLKPDPAARGKVQVHRRNDIPKDALFHQGNPVRRDRCRAQETGQRAPEDRGTACRVESSPHQMAGSKPGLPARADLQHQTRQSRRGWCQRTCAAAALPSRRRCARDQDHRHIACSALSDASASDRAARADWRSSTTCSDRARACSASFHLRPPVRGFSIPAGVRRQSVRAVPEPDALPCPSEKTHPHRIRSPSSRLLVKPGLMSALPARAMWGEWAESLP